MNKCPVELGDQVVHQSHPGRFTVVAIENRPRMNVYSNILTIRSDDGVEMRVLDTVVRKLDPPAAPAETAAGNPDTAGGGD